MEKAISFKEFQQRNMPDGHYAIWTSSMIPTSNFKEEAKISGSFAYGFSGAVIEYTSQEGFVGEYPDWIDKCDDNDLKIILLEELPTIDDLR